MLRYMRMRAPRPCTLLSVARRYLCATLVARQARQYAPSARGNSPSRRPGVFGGDRPSYNRWEDERSRSGRQHDVERQAPETFLAQNAEALLGLKRAYKQAKLSRDRRSITNEARQLIGRTRIDPSTQDEKSVVVFLNCAVMFKYGNSFGVKQAIQWMRDNLSGLSPQNLALFVNAVGALKPHNAVNIVVDEAMPLVQAMMRDFAPVEAVMILQALGRLKIVTFESVQDEMLRQLATCISSMPVTQLSTLAVVLSRSTFSSKYPTECEAMMRAIEKKALGDDVAQMHSKQAVAFLTAVAILPASIDPTVRLLKRTIDTCRFHDCIDIIDTLRALSRLRHSNKAADTEVTAHVKTLIDSLLERIDVCAPYAAIGEISSIWQNCKMCGVDLPGTTQEKLLTCIVDKLAYTRPKCARLAQLLHSACDQQLPSLKAFDILGDYCIGIRSPPNEQERGEEDDAGIGEDELNFMYTHEFDNMTKIRLDAENLYATHKAPLPTSFAVTLPQLLMQHLPSTSLLNLLRAVVVVSLGRADCPLRHTACDKAIIAEAEARLAAGGSCLSTVTTTLLQHVIDKLQNSEVAQGVVRAIDQLLRERRAADGERVDASSECSR